MSWRLRVAVSSSLTRNHSRKAKPTTVRARSRSSDDHAQKILLAYSVPEGKIVWRYPQVGRGNSWGGTLTTAGDLVFFANDTGAFEAVEARTGRALWQFNTGQTIHASPMSYAVDGVQYVAIAAGSDVISFSLPH